MPVESLNSSLETLRRITPRRLIQEDHGIKGCAWFGRKADSKWHVVGNVVRIVVHIAVAPLYIIQHLSTFVGFYNTKDEEIADKMAWFSEFSNIFNAVLHTSP
ncbi:hypothetical protein M422DRAFT_275560, partial [Sphaerobolus stellatus SS14]